MKHNIIFTEIYMKEGETFEGKPLMLFLTHGKDEELGMFFTKINCGKNPLPIGNKVYHPTAKLTMNISAWLKNHGWIRTGTAYPN